MRSVVAGVGRAAECHATAAGVIPEETAAADDTLRVVLFCGGRGSSTIVSEFMRHPEVHLSLVINAYDDGLSTGALRSFIPDMLGPSDFRKNLSRVLQLHSTEQYALRRLLEYRIPEECSELQLESLRRLVYGETGADKLAQPLGSLFEDLSSPLARRLASHLRNFFDYEMSHGSQLSYSDCSLGNLVFAGAYLSSSHNFNESLRSLATVCCPRANLINVTRGDNRILVALKMNGEILARESEIVGPQSASPITDLFFVERPLSADFLQSLSGLTTEEKRRRLRTLDSPPEISVEARSAILEADAILYGPGTQYSSLLPSYRTRGLSDALRQSRARARIFIANLDQDHDIQSLDAPGLVDTALSMLGDPDNRWRYVTHIFYDRGGTERPRGIPSSWREEAGTAYKGATVVTSQFENVSRPGTHSGYAVVSNALSVLRGGREKPKSSLDIYMDLLDRGDAKDLLWDEFVDLPWRDTFDSVRLAVNRNSPAGKKPPAGLSVVESQYEAPFTEIEALSDWLANSDSEYLATLAGDGEYRLSDVLMAVEVLKSGTFGMVLGSRRQSRKQFRGSLYSAYGEHPLLHGLSWLGAFAFSIATGLRLGLTFSDPVTGFRVYRRSHLGGHSLQKMLADRKPRSLGALLCLLVGNRVEIAEIPVCYRTFRGFTRPSWRIRRAVRNLAGFLV